MNTELLQEIQEIQKVLKEGGSLDQKQLNLLHLLLEEYGSMLGQSVQFFVQRDLNPFQKEQIILLCGFVLDHVNAFDQFEKTNPGMVDLEEMDQEEIDGWGKDKLQAALIRISNFSQDARPLRQSDLELLIQCILFYQAIVRSISLQKIREAKPLSGLERVLCYQVLELVRDFIPAFEIVQSHPLLAQEPKR